MRCSMCFSSDGKLQMIETNDNDTLKRIKFVLPDFLIPESMDPVFICSTCLEQVSFFHTIKKTSLENCSRLKHYNAVLKGTDNFKCNELRVIVNSDKGSVQPKHQIKFKVNPNSKYLLSSEDQDAEHIKEEDETYEIHYQHFVNDESSSALQVNKLNKKDSNLTSGDSIHEDQPKTQNESRKKRFKCTDCHKEFFCRSHLEIHGRVHTGEKPFKCTTCQKTFTLRCNLNTHKLTHTGEKPHECDVCLKTFTQRGNLERHSRVHTGNKPYKCTTCQKTFTQLANLNKHKLTHTGEKPHECDVCHKTFNQKGSLITHKRFHNNLRPFKCAVCSKRFTISGDLTRHMFTHTGEKPHQCHLCKYKCVRARDLEIHIRRHTGEKPYSCKHCEKSFAATSYLKTHERRLHRNEDSD